MSFIQQCIALANVHLNGLYLIVPMFVCISFILYIICVRFDLIRNQTRNILQDKGPFLFVTSHPDDECMFFAPAILQLAKMDSDKVHLICVTTGNYYKKGAVRRKEIYKSCEILGIPANNVQVLDNSSFADGNDEWDFGQLIPELSHHINTIKPTHIFTFDEQGVSGHPNHISTSKALRSLLAAEKAKKEIAVLLELRTVPIYRKYISFLDLLPTVTSSSHVFVLSISQVVQAQRAMCSHVSQFVWFRALYILFSRYMLINDYTQINL